ncbi:hypothetical protein MOQ14_03200 [Stenotrophomonas maltophilia]|uniref:hypothetical protein n=1 Tax=Stenotrophomonas maltophilia TaxID=40324 RepID=UPI0013125402|nr:hypothetical protein [Stenotrophomonas maltophilia]MCI1137568.1 hypothetical protein [Stenotrophomonas maltophilia]
MNPLRISDDRERDWTAVAAIALGMLGLLAVLAYQYRLLHFIEWGDESETIVAAKMMVAGSSLYRDIFNHHGPLTFLPGMVVELLGGHSIPAHRVFIALLQLGALASLFFSPLIRDKHVSARVTYVLLAATVYVGFLPSSFGHSYIYQVMCGLMLSIALSSWLLPLLVDVRTYGKVGTVLGSALVTSLPFLAVTYVPAAALLLLASLRQDNWRSVMIGAAAGVAFNLVFLVMVGSVKGFIAFHLYMNSTLLSQYGGGQTSWQYIASAFSTATSDLGSLTLLTLIVVSLTAAATRVAGFPWRHALVALALGSLLVRGGGFHGLSYAYAALAVPLLLVASAPAQAPRKRSLLLVLCCVLLARLVVGGPGEKQLMKERRIPETTEFAEVARALTEPGDKVLAYSFQNFQYIASNRLPASGYYFYLPWQRDYLDKPILDIRIDPCKDIQTGKPKLIMLDEWNVWDRYAWSTYGGCVIDIVAREYVRLPGTPYYARRDLAEKIGLASSVPVELIPSAPVQPGDRFDLPDPAPSNKGATLRVGFMLGTHARRNEGIATLTTTDAAGSKSTLGNLPLADVKDNAFAYFTVPAGISGDLAIDIQEGGGVSVWEARSSDGATQPCIAIQFEHGPPSFTPGCPVDFGLLLGPTHH